MSQAPGLQARLQALRYSSSPAPSLKVLDQLQLPGEAVYLPVTDADGAHAVISSMQVRGAPLIAMVAVLGLAVDMSAKYIGSPSADGSSADGSSAASATGSASSAAAYAEERLAFLATSRPTAVNLFNAIADVRAALALVKDSSDAAVCATVQAAAERLLAQDVSNNEALGEAGAAAIKALHPAAASLSLVTICNTGSLATAGHGTALGVARSLHATSSLGSLAILETRPYNQGSRLTAYEALEDGLPGAKLLCDSAAAAYLAKGGVHAAVVGADRVAANGDTANKIGT